MKKHFLLLLLTTITLFTCEKDDICAEGTPTTPRLLVEFYDAAAPEEAKNVSKLLVYGKNDSNENVFFKEITVQNINSVLVPLRIDNDITKLVFHMDYEIDDMDTPDDTSDDVVLGNPDIFDIAYTTEDVYVSRACGYKTIFNNLNPTRLTDTDNWTTNVIITAENATVKDENTAHLHIFH